MAGSVSVALTQQFLENRPLLQRGTCESVLNRIQLIQRHEDDWGQRSVPRTERVG